MDGRKPFSVPFESWVDQQIAESQRRGDFDDLPGKGRPLKPVDTSDPAWWIKQKLADERLDVPLPAQLELKQEARRQLAALALLDDERQVREGIALLNERIRKVNATTISGPPTDVAPVDVERFVARWRDRVRSSGA